MSLNEQLQDLFIRSIWVIGGKSNLKLRASIALSFYRGTIDHKGPYNTHGGTLEGSKIQHFYKTL